MVTRTSGSEERTGETIRRKRRPRAPVRPYHFNIRLEENRQCILVLMGATAEGQKELIAVVDGYRESEQSWRQLLLDSKQRGLTVDPKLAIGDGALGFWREAGKRFVDEVQGMRV